MPTLTGGQVIVHSLRAHGVDTVFGIIATHTLHLYDALYEAQGSIQHIGGRTEAGLGFMAGGYARASGRPGVFITSAGPGAAGSIGAMGEELHSCSAVLQVTTNVEHDLVGLGRGARHESKDQGVMFRTVTDWNALIPDVPSIPAHVAEAFRRFQVRRPRPIALEVPTDLLGAAAEVTVRQPADATLPAGDPAAVESAARYLRRARRPLLLAGDQVGNADATPELVRLADILGAPVGLLDGGKGSFPDDHPLALGIVLGGRHWGRNSLWEDLLPSCDLAVVIGSNLLYRDTVALGLRLPMPLVHIDLDAESFGKNYPAEVAIAGHPKVVLQQLLDALGDGDRSKGDAFRRDVQRARERAQRTLVEQWPNEARAFAAIRSVLPRETIMVADVTVPAIRADRCFATYEPRTWLEPWGWFGLGFGFPAALGAKVARPDRPVVCLTGDGGFQFNLQELATAVQERIAPIVVVFNDQAWGVLKERQRRLLDGRYIATDLYGPDLIKLAEAYGAAATRVSDLNGLLRALDNALAATTGTLQLIEVEIPSGIERFR